jgi:methanogenic corrinoid protein MtbC1
MELSRCSTTRSSSLEEVGARFERGDYFVPEMLTRALQSALTSSPSRRDRRAPVGTFVMGTVGRRCTTSARTSSTSCSSAGFTVIDLGVNVAPEKFVEIVEHKPDTSASPS